MAKKKKVFITGLKLLLLNIIAGVIAFFINLIVGAISLATATIATVGIIISAILVLGGLLLIIYVGGAVAQKLFGWK